MPAPGTVLVLALASMAAAGPQAYGPPAPVPRILPGFNAPTVNPVRDIYSDIREGRDSGQLSRKQAKELRREVGEIGMLQDRYSHGGLTEAEQAELRTRAEVTRAITTQKRLGAIK